MAKTSLGTWESNTGLGVQSHYGARGTSDAGGVIVTEGIRNEVRLIVDGTMLSNGALPLARLKIPAGAKVIRADVAVSEAFTIGGTTPAVEIGTQGSEATNGFQITEAQAEAVGSVEITSFNGTWAAELAAETTIDVALSGTSPTSAATGEMSVTITYVKQD